VFIFRSRRATVALANLDLADKVRVAQFPPILACHRVIRTARVHSDRVPKPCGLAA
jgi:hypothetical protein